MTHAPLLDEHGKPVVRPPKKGEWYLRDGKPTLALLWDYRFDREIIEPPAQPDASTYDLKFMDTLLRSLDAKTIARAKEHAEAGRCTKFRWAIGVREDSEGEAVIWRLGPEGCREAVSNQGEK